MLFGDMYTWAGDIRSIDISKGDTRFCNCNRIEAEANKQFEKLKAAGYFENDCRNYLGRALISVTEFTHI